MIFTPEQYFCNTPPPRFIGTETEYNVQIQGSNDCNVFIGDNVVSRAGFVIKKTFLDNGGRIYKDSGNHLEYDTAESLGPRQAAASDSAGIMVVRKIVKASGVEHNGVHRHSGTIKNGHSTTSGYHENYLMPVELADESFISALLPSHLASRIYSFSGIVGINGFNLSQKVRGIGGNPIETTTNRRTVHGDKPMVMLRKKDDTIGSDKWIRAEIRYADAGFSPTGRFLTFATTSLVLRLIENYGVIDIKDLESHAFKDPVSAAKRISEDLSFTEVHETTSGKSITAIDLQEILANACARLSTQIHLPEDEKIAIKLWIDTCDQLRKCNLQKNEYGKLLGISDFAIRHFYLSTRLRPEEIKSDNKRARALNLLWDRILPEGGAMTYWETIDSPYVSTEEIEWLIHNPPNTRAYLRSESIRTRDKKIENVNWDFIFRIGLMREQLSPAYVHTD